MVKNVKGGSGHKSQARKFSSLGSSAKQGSKLRVVEESGEIYAQITKIYGNGMCDALCIDNVTRLCMIRGKFRGRGKRDNSVGVGSWILGGKREWESERKNEKEKCDLLEVYSDFDIERLKKSINENWKIFACAKETTTTPDDDALEFTSANTEEYERIMQTLGDTANDKILLSINEDAGADEEVCIDDI